MSSAPVPPATSYPASAFHPDFEGGRAPGSLSFPGGHLRFEAAEGGRAFDLPLDGIELRLGGASDRILFFAHPSLPEVTVFTSDHSVLEHPQLRSQPQVADQVAAVHGKKSRARLAAAAVLVALPALAAGLFLLKDPLIAFAANRVPPSLEVRLGEVIFAQMRTSLSLVEDPELDAALAELVEPLMTVLPDAGYPFDLHIVEDPTLNAFAIPGGNVVLHSGLLLRAETPEEVLGVLAHEIAHVTRRHSLRNLIGTAGVLLVVQSLLGDASGLLAAAAEGGTYLLTLRFSRDFERQADDTGWDYLLDAGVDPRGMISFFGKLQAATEEHLGDAAELGSTLDFLSTHPSSAERIERLTAKWEKAGYDTAPKLEAADFEAFRVTLRKHLGSAEASEAPP